MRVSALQLFLRSLRPAVTAAGGGSSLPADLDAVAAGLEPFAPLDFSQFAAFLRQAEHYRTSGAVPVPAPASPGLENVQTSLRRAASLADKLAGADGLQGQQILAAREETRHELEQAIAAFLKPLAIKVALKGDQKEFQVALKKAGTQALAARLRSALDGVTDEASLNAPERQQRLLGIVDRMDAADLKAVATQLGAQATGRTKESLLSAIVAQVTGFKPAAKKTTPGSRMPAVDQAAVQQQAIKLKELLEKSMDRELSGAEIEAAISELDSRNVAELKAIASEIGLEKPGAKKPGILKKFREKLREADRARESIQV